MPTKPVRSHILGNKVEFSQNALHFIQNSFLLQYFREQFSNGESLSDGTLHGSFLLEQKFIEQRLTCDKMMVVKHSISI